MSDIVELQVPAQAEYLQLVRAIVGAVAAADPDMASERVVDLRLAVSEAVTNAIRAQERFSVPDRVTIRCNLAENSIEVEVADRGPGFDPDQVPDLPSVETPERLDHESGLGLSLMRELADETVIESGPDGTAVRLIIRYGAGREAR